MRKKDIETAKTGSAQSETKTVKKRRISVIPFIVCLFFAVVIWYYVMQVDNPDYQQTISGVKVSLVNTDELTNRGLSIFNGTSYYADITVSGKKSVINSYSNADIVIKADILKHYTNPGMQVVDLDVQLPGGLTLISQDNTISVFVDEKTTVKLPLTVDQRTGATTSADYETGTLVPEFTEITVKGPKTITGSIDKAVLKADFSEFGVLESTITTTGSVVLYNKSGEEMSSAYLTLDYPTMNVTFPIYLTKEVPITVSYKHGLYNDSNVSLEFSPDVVAIRGEAADVKKITSINAGVIDEKQIDKDKTLTFGLVPEIEYEFVDDVTAVKVSITNVGTVTKIYRVHNLVVKGGGKQCEVTDEYVDVTLRGSAAALASIKAEDITVSCDISDYDDAINGDYSFNAEVTVAGSPANVWEIGFYKLNVQVTKNA